MIQAIDEVRLQSIFAQAKKNTWDAQVPRVPMNIRLAISSINSQLPNFWNCSAGEVVAVLERNPGVKEIFENNQDYVLAFAIRDIRMMD